MNRQQISFPPANDLRSILIDSINKTDLLRFARSKGIFLFNATQEEIAQKISEMLLDYEELNILRSLAYKTTTKQLLCGFTLVSEGTFDFAGIYNSLRDNGALKEDGYELKRIAKITNESGKNAVYQGALIYKRKSVGRIEFIRTEQRDVSFIMKEIEPNRWQVEVDGGKSNDGKAVYGLLEKAIRGQSIQIESLRIDHLTNSETISFFDKLAKEGLDKDEWVIDDIEGITLKRNAGTKNHDEIDPEYEEVSKEQLSGISRAILEGKNLRENDFIKQAETSGYAFTSMVYVFHSKINSRKVRLKAEFKGNPKIFEVCLESFLEPSANNEDSFDDITSSMSDNDNINIRSEFWNNAKLIYLNITTGRIQ